MADWSVSLMNAGDYLSSLSISNHDEATFCTNYNIDDCVKHLNSELVGLGLSPLYRDGAGLTTSALNNLNDVLRMYQKTGRVKEELENRDGASLTTSALNNLNDVLRMYQKTGRVKEELENRLHRINSDLTQNYSITKHLKSDNERLGREVAKEREKHRQTDSKLRSISAKLKKEKEELKKLQSIVKTRDTHYLHEMKKKEREINKLMDRLNHLLMDKTPDRKIGMEMVGLLHRGDNKRSKWKNTSSSNKQEEMYQLLIHNYEEKQQELRVENSNLRDCLMDMQRELTGLLDMSSDVINENISKNGGLSASSSETDLSTSSCLSNDITDDYFQMPYDILRENLQKNFQDTCKKIKDSIKKCSNSSHSSKKSSGRSISPSKSPSKHYNDNKDTERKSEEVDKLAQQIEKYKEIVKQQEELIQKSLHTQSKSMENSFLQESQILQEKESLSEQRRKFYQEKANFEDERRKFTELALQLQQERKLIENQRNEFFKAHFLQISPSKSKPPTPNKSCSAEKTRLLPSTPMFSPAPCKSKNSSPADLLKMIQAGKQQLSSSDRSSSKRSLNKSNSHDSLVSMCMSAHSAHSAPSDLTHSTHSTTSKLLTFEELGQFDSDIPSLRHKARSSTDSTGSQSSLDGR